MHILEKMPNIPLSVNPMTMSDEEFAKFRLIGDDVVGMPAVATFDMIDGRYLHRSLSKMVNNEDRLDLDNVVLKSTWDAPAESLPTWKKMAENFLEEYFNDPPVDSKNRERLQLFQISDYEREVLQNAAKFYCNHMTEATLALAVRSLLKQYAAYNSTSVLIATKLLPDYPHRRIISTMQFVMDVMDLNAFSPKGRGLKAIQKLRLIHAMIRDRLEGVGSLQEGKPTWDQAKLGSPINQQDMLFAIHTFSIEVIQGLIASGEKISEADIANYYYAWHIIGRLLGVSHLINPTDYNIGVQIQQKIYAKEFTTNNENAVHLAEPLIKFLDDLLPGANRPGVLGIVKLFNDKKDYKPIFKDILKIDLDEASDYYTALYKTADFLRHFLTKVKFIFLPNAKKSDFLADIAKNQYKLLKLIIDVEKTWTDEAFRIADGYGVEAAKEDLELSKMRPSFMKRILSAISQKLFRKE